jgi:hypothetical protein
MSDKHHVFISYSRKDYSFVEKLRTDLEKAGIFIWIDKEGIRFGTPNWERAIRKAIDEAYAVIWVVSPDSYASDYVRDELAIAKMKNCPIYPVWASGNDWLDCVPIGMGHIQYIDARKLKQKNQYLNALPIIIKVLSEGKSVLAVPNVKPKPLPSGRVPRNPYKGLHAFQETDVRDFFGREQLTEILYDALESRFVNKHPRFLGVIGASGSGKSSVVMAGLLPKLRKNSWTHILNMIPSRNPLQSLAQSLYKALPNKSFTAIAEDLNHKSGEGLNILAGLFDSHVLLFVDQFEELFTLVETEDERMQFINLITTASTEPNGNLTLVLTMRADYYDRPMNYLELGKLIENYSKSVLPMSLIELRDAVERPALADDVSLVFEPGLVGEIVFELRDRTEVLAGALPLLQFTLERLFEKRQENSLTLAAYADIGGVQGAIGNHANEVFESLDEDVQNALPRVFYRLVAVDENGTATRQRTRLTVFAADELAQILIDELTNARLLVVDWKDDESFVEVAHEALLSSWDKLRQWIEVTKEDLRLLHRVEIAAREWDERGRPDYLLWTYELQKPVYEMQHRLTLTFSGNLQEFMRPELERLMKGFSDSAPYHQRTVVERLVSFGVDAIPMLIEALAYAQKNDIIEAIYKGFHAMSVASVPILCNALQHPEAKMRVAAIKGLAELNVYDAVPFIISVSEDNDHTVRWAVIEAIRLFNDERGVGAVVRALSDQSEIVKRAAINTINNLKDFAATTWISELSRQKLNPLAVETIAYILAGSKDPTVISLTIDTLGTDVSSSLAIAKLLDLTVNTETVPALIAALQHPQWVVQRSAVSALQRMGTSQATIAVKEWREEQERKRKDNI